MTKRKKYEYKHVTIGACTEYELTCRLNEWGQLGYQVVSHAKSDVKGFASIILMREVEDNNVTDK